MCTPRASRALPVRDDLQETLRVVDAARLAAGAERKETCRRRRRRDRARPRLRLRSGRSIRSRDGNTCAGIWSASRSRRVGAPAAVLGTATTPSADATCAESQGVGTTSPITQKTFRHGRAAVIVDPATVNRARWRCRASRGRAFSDKGCRPTAIGSFSASPGDSVLPLGVRARTSTPPANFSTFSTAKPCRPGETIPASGTTPRAPSRSPRPRWERDAGASRRRVVFDPKRAGHGSRTRPRPRPSPITTSDFRRFP